LARYALAQQHTLGGWYRRRVLGVDSDLPTDRHVRALAAGMRGARRVGPLADARPMAGSDGGSVAWQWAQDLPPGSNALAPAWAGREFAVAVSLGAFCHTAAVLRRLEMREGSGPLDWVFMNPAAVLHALQDGFRTFLDASHFEVVDAADKVDPHANVCEHRYYRQRFGVRYLFNHHNPTAPTDAAYFARCVQRFQAQMAAATAADGRGNDAVAPCLLVLMSYEPVAPAQVLAMRQALGAAAPGCFVLVLQLRVVRDVAAQLAGAYALADAGSHHAILNFCVRAPSDGLVFPYAEENDALAQLLNAFSVRRHKRHAPD
jgi:hypothetical protein